MSQIVRSRFFFAALAFVLGVASTFVVLQPWSAGAQLSGVQLDGLKKCLKGDKVLSSETGEQIEVQIVALELEGVSPSVGPDPFPIALVPPGSVVPGAPVPDATLAGDDLSLDVYYDVSLTDLGGVLAPLPFWCGFGLCRGECPNGILICKKNSDC